MTMRTLLAATAIISSAIGVGKAPVSHSTYDSSFARLGFASANTQLGEEFASLDQQATPIPPEPWVKSDPADSLYRLAREAMSRGDYKRAAELFHRIPERFPQSAYASQAIYYEAYSLYRSGGDDDLSAARDRLNQLKQRDAKVWKSDGAVLLTRVCGELAKRGDEACAADSERNAQKDPPVQTGKSCPDEDEENDDRIAALNALLQMDADRAMPILQKVLARRDACSAGLRRKAVFLVSQKRTPETANILMNVARTDPDQEVREQAVFWLSQVPGDETAIALDSILRDPKTDPEIQEKAIFALSQHRGTRAGATLRAFAERSDVNSDLREKAIFWLGQNRSEDNAQFLKDLYKKLDNDDLKEKVIFSLSQMGGADNYRWLMDIALDSKEDIELRKKALFWAGQGRTVDVADLVRLYDSMNDREMKEQLIFVYSQRREDAALDKLFQIGKNDPDRELRKKAIFWIGQSRSPRAAQYLQELINQ